MGNKIEFDSFMKKYAQDNADLTKGLEPDFAKIEAGAINATKKNALIARPAFRIAAAVVALFIVFSVGTLFSGSGIVSAYRQRALNILNTIADGGTSGKNNGFAVKAEEPDITAAQKKVPFHIPQPHWLPENYSFQRIDLTDNGNGLYRVVLRYVNDDQKLYITYDNDSEGLMDSSSNEDERYEEIDAQGVKVYYHMEEADEQYNSNAIFLTKEGLLVNVSAPVDKQAILQLIIGLY